MEVLSKIRSFLLAIILFIMSLFGISPGTPDTPDAPDFPVVPDSQIENVIMMIGDGMGMMSLEKTKHETGRTLTMDSFACKGKSQTASADNSVTDSAAGATALACGVRTNNGCIGVYPDDVNAATHYPMNLCEIAISEGMKTGIVTTDSTRGATPGGFSAHTSSRNNTSDITNQQIQSGIDLIWGIATSTCSREATEKAGYQYISDYASMAALTEGSRSFGQFTDDLWREDCGDMPTLTQMTVKAIDLLDDDPNGFFLMVEGAHIDKNSHNNNSEGMNEALLSFDEAVKAALDYAKQDGHTLVVVTADHETGGITLKNGEYVYTTTGHTGADVPVLVYGYDAFFPDGAETILNTDIPKRITAVLQIENFPRSLAA